MARLTTYKSECKREMICRYEDCMTDEEYCPHLNEDNCPCLQEILEKLAEYEDLEERLQNIYGDHHGLLDEVVAGLERHEKIDLPQQVIKSRLLIDESVDQWEEYKTLDKQGKLLKLPCAVGDTVWYISERVEKQGRKKAEVSFVDKGTVDNITVGCLMIPQIIVCNEENIWTTFDSVEDFGKTVFLTKEEADTALKEAKK